MRTPVGVMVEAVVIAISAIALIVIGLVGIRKAGVSWRDEVVAVVLAVVVAVEIEAVKWFSDFLYHGQI